MERPSLLLLALALGLCAAPFLVQGGPPVPSAFFVTGSVLII